MFTPRMTAGQLCRLYGSTGAALEAGDFYTALRLAGGDPLAEGVALTMLGHERRGLALLEGVGDLPDWARLVQALGLWLVGGCDAEARALAGSLAARAPDFAPALTLVQGMAVQRPHLVYACGAANTLRAADQLKASDEVRVTVLRNVPHKADVAFGPATPADRLAAAIGDDVDCVFLDNLIMLPPQLAAIPAPKIAQVFDIEFFYAQRARELGWIDLLVCPGNSMDHASARLRFGDHCIQRALALDELMQVEVDPAAMAEAGDRPIDVLATGGVDKPFFPDKQHRLGALAQAGAGLDIRVVGRYLAPDRYRELTRAAKYAFATNRASNAILGRAFEALANGTMVAAEADCALPLLFGEALAGVHLYRDGHVGRDLTRMVADYPQHRAAFARGAPALADALKCVLPGPEQAARRMVRTLTFWSALARRRLGWRDVVGGAAAAPRRSFAPSGADCYAAKQESWLGLPGDLRGRLLGPLADTSADDALAMPRLGQTVTAQAFLAVNRLDADLYRHQAEGQRAAGSAILSTLNRARRRRPLSLATWYLIGRHLADTGRFGPAIRLFEQLVLRADALVLEPRVTIGDSNYEVADWPFVDAMMRDDLARQHPQACGRSRDIARSWILGRAHALLAGMHARRGNAAAFDHYAARALRQAGRDVGVLGLVMDGAIAAWPVDQDPARLRLAARAYFRGMRRSLRFLFDHFPEALELLAHLERQRLALLLARYWLRAKLRLYLDGDAPVVTDDERFIHRRHTALFSHAADAFAGTRLAPKVENLLAALAVTDSHSAVA